VFPYPPDATITRKIPFLPVNHHHAKPTRLSSAIKNIARQSILLIAGRHPCTYTIAPTTSKYQLMLWNFYLSKIVATRLTSHPIMPNTRANRASRKLSTNTSSDNDYVDNSQSPSPSCDNSVIPEGNSILCDLNSGQEFSSPSVDAADDSPSTVDKESTEDVEDESSASSDETWTPSVDGEDSENELDMDDNGRIWQEVPIRPQDFTISFNKVDSDLEMGYKEEVKELKKRVFSLLCSQIKPMIERNKDPVDVKEFEMFL